MEQIGLVGNRNLTLTTPYSDLGSISDILFVFQCYSFRNCDYCDTK